jgi:hypothetical protein
VATEVPGDSAPGERQAGNSACELQLPLRRACACGGGSSAQVYLMPAAADSSAENFPSNRKHSIKSLWVDRCYQESTDVCRH